MVPAAAAVATLAGCASSIGFLRVPVTVDPTHPGGLVIVRVPLAELRQRIDGFEPEHADYYFRGREPIAHEYRDTDHDGEPDIVVVKLPRDFDEHWLVVVHPSDLPDPPMPPGGSARGVRIDFAKAQK